MDHPLLYFPPVPASTLYLFRVGFVHGHRVRSTRGRRSQPDRFVRVLDLRRNFMNSSARRPEATCL